MTNFTRIVPILSSNSESVRKTGLVLAYELGFRCSIYQNRSEIFFGSVRPPQHRGRKILFWQKNWSQDPLFVVTRFVSINLKFLNPGKAGDGRIQNFFLIDFDIWNIEIGVRMRKLDQF